MVWEPDGHSTLYTHLEREGVREGAIKSGYDQLDPLITGST